MTTIDQEIDWQLVPIYGPEPIGDRQSGVVQDDAIRQVNGTAGQGGQGKMRLNRRGISGDPSRTCNADLGALQGDFTAVRTVAAPNSYRPGFSTALPSTSGGGTIQDSLGQLGI